MWVNVYYENHTVHTLYYLKHKYKVFIVTLINHCLDFNLSLNVNNNNMFNSRSWEIVPILSFILPHYQCLIKRRMLEYHSRKSQGRH